MNEISVLTAVIDFIPVILCAVTIHLLTSDMYKRMSQKQYTFFSSGGVMLVAGGFLKALWKLLYTMDIIDIQIFSEMFFPIQSMAFIFMSISCFRMISKNKNLAENKILSVSAVPVLTSHVPFIIIMFWGMTAWYTSLCIVAGKIKAKKAVIFIITAYVFMLVQSSMGSKFDNSSAFMHWVAELSNTFAQAFLMLGAIFIHNAMKNENSDNS